VAYHLAVSIGQEGRRVENVKGCSCLRNGDIPSEHSYAEFTSLKGCFNPGADKNCEVKQGTSIHGPLPKAIEP